MSSSAYASDTDDNNDTVNVVEIGADNNGSATEPLVTAGARPHGGRRQGDHHGGAGRGGYRRPYSCLWGADPERRCVCLRRLLGHRRTCSIRIGGGKANTNDFCVAQRTESSSHTASKGQAEIDTCSQTGGCRLTAAETQGDEISLARATTPKQDTAVASTIRNLFVRDWSGGSFCLNDVPPSWTVRTLQQRIAMERGYNPEALRLLWVGKSLEPGTTAQPVLYFPL